MPNSNAAITVFVPAWLMVLAMLPVMAQTAPSPPSNEDQETSIAEERVIVARIFDHEVAADDLVIEGEEEHLRKTLTPDDFERWQPTHRVSALWGTVVPRALEHWADKQGVIVSEQQVEQLAQRMLDNWPQKDGQPRNEKAPNEKVKAFAIKFARGMVTERTIARALHESTAAASRSDRWEAASRWREPKRYFSN